MRLYDEIPGTTTKKKKLNYDHINKNDFYVAVLIFMTRRENCHRVCCLRPDPRPRVIKHIPIIASAEFPKVQFPVFMLYTGTFRYVQCVYYEDRKKKNIIKTRVTLRQRQRETERKTE